jgi:hypothetical protein
MSLTRAELNAAVTGELAGVLTLAGFAATDTSGAMKEVLDRTFRALGIAESGLGTAAVADGAEAQAIAYLRYFVVDKAVWATTTKMNVKAGSAAANLREQHENLLRLLNAALAQAQACGLPLPGNGRSPYVPVPFAGGIDQGDYDARADDASRVPPLFSSRDLPLTPAWGEPW